MKVISLFIIIFSLFLFISCEEGKEYFYYYKSFFIAEDEFVISGEVFVNDNLTENAVFNTITAKVETVNGWIINDTKVEPGSGFSLTVTTDVNGSVLSNSTINLDLEPDIFFRLPGFPYHVLTFTVDGRAARGAIEPSFSQPYYFVYVPEVIDASTEYSEDNYTKFGTSISYYIFDLDFFRPGWYKIYHSNKFIRNNAAYSSGNNTRIRAPR